MNAVTLPNSMCFGEMLGSAPITSVKHRKLHLRLNALVSAAPFLEARLDTKEGRRAKIHGAVNGVRLSHAPPGTTLGERGLEGATTELVPEAYNGLKELKNLAGNRRGEPGRREHPRPPQ